MKTTQTTPEFLESNVNDFMAEFCPFGWMDCKAAVQSANEAGYNYKWAVEQIEQFCDDTDTKLADVDPVYIVMDAILQEARNEISELTDFDLCNDCTDTEIYTAGNFMCTSYDYAESSLDLLKSALGKHNVEIDTLSDATQYFLSELGISQDDINKAKEE